VSERSDLADQHLQRVLVALAGPEAVAREDQRQAVHALVVDHTRVLVVQATGWGKSAVYWAATSALRASGSGLTLVISPLLALMRDQVTAAQRAGLVAATINSTNIDEWDSVLADVDADRVDVLLVAPERLANPRFAARLPALLARTGMVVIDEAHCISDWGFDFRPDYQRLARHLLTLAPGTPVLATTATANERVTADVALQLGEGTVTFRGSLARRSLQLAVVPGLGPLDRWAWVADALATFAGSGIVYTLTVAEAERLAGYLASLGHAVAAYTGKLDAPARVEIEELLRHNRLRAVVATSALGMGYDKPDLAFCIHAGSPSSPVAYYQQVGRAGRALDTAQAVLLPSESDERIWQYFATASVPDREHVDRVLDQLSRGAVPLASLESTTGIRRTRLEAVLRLLAADDIVVKEADGWAATGRPYVHDAAKWDALRAMREHEAELMRRYAAGAGCLMEFLQLALDDPDPSPCGRCSVCTGTLPPPGARPSDTSLTSARAFARGVDVAIEPRKLWPSGLGSVDGRAAPKGRIVGCGDGRALAFADDPGWTAELVRFHGADRELEPVVVDGLVEVLRRWKDHWGTRPVAVVPMPSRSHPVRVRSMADHIGRIGKLPVVDVLRAQGPTPPTDTASGARVRAVLQSLRLVGAGDDAGGDGLGVPRGPVLLVDDTYRTGWTMTVAASLLREAGATAVLPLVVQQLP